MKSRITIEVDFDNGNKPVILAKLEQSDDVRDKLIQNFTEILGGQSSWCKTMFIGDGVLRISPISTNELAEQSSLMGLMAGQLYHGVALNQTQQALVGLPLDGLLSELKFGRSKQDQDFLDKMIDVFVSEELFDRCFPDKKSEKKDNFWVIEFSEQPRNTHVLYLTANLDKVANINDAVRFADRKSAEAFMECNVQEGIVVEHAWS